MNLTLDTQHTEALPGFDLGNLIDAGLGEQRTLDDANHTRPAPCPVCEGTGTTPQPPGACPRCHGDKTLWYWYASELARCPRRLVLARAGLAVDPTPRSGLLTFALGNSIHERIQAWAEAYARAEPRFSLVGVEIGHLHPTLPLKARSDLVFRWEDRLAIAEIKSEKPGASTYRAKEAQTLGYPWPVKFDHWLQATATAMCLEPIFDEPITIGRALYVQKVDWFVDAVPMDLGSTRLRDEVHRLVDQAESNWVAYLRAGTLPPRLAAKDEVWECSQRQPSERDGEGDPRGRWCPARAACFGRPA